MTDSFCPLRNKSKMSKHVVITGANVGIGKAAAKLFLSKDFRVTIVGRSKEKLEAAKNELGNVEIGICDISSQSSMDEFVKKVEPIDILVNNAGVWLNTYQKTDLNQELTFQTNHLGTMYLTVKLMENNKFHDKASIIIVSSDLHKKGVDDLNFYDNLNEKNYSGNSAYCQSKLYNLLLSLYLINNYVPEKYPEKNFKITTVHPGFIPTTELSRNLNFFLSFIKNFVLPLFPFTTTVEDAANRIYMAAIDEDSNGKYVGNKGYEDTSELAKDQEFATALWKKSVEILKLK